MCVGYVLKRYPRYSETFVVNEILAHEAAGLNIKIFALRPPSDTHFQNIISQVRAPVTYIKKPIQGRVSESLNSLAPTAASYFWAELQEASKVIPDFWPKLAIAQGEQASTVYQAAWLAREARLKGITHLHAHFGTVATSVARLASHFTGIPYTFTAHAKDIFHEEAKLLIVGDGPERENLEAELAAHGLDSHTQFTGAVNPDAVPKLLARMDVAVAPYPAQSDFYFSPLKVYEYMAAGLPVVASRIGQLADLIDTGVNGILCPPGDAIALAEALETLWRSPTLRQRLGEAARQKVMDNHTWDAIAQQILNLAGLNLGVRR